MATTQTGVGATSPRPSDDIRCTYSDHGFSVRSASAQIAKSHQGVESGGETGLASTESSDGPDGGITAWLVVLGAWCASFCCYGWINSIGTFQEYYQSGPLKEYSASQIAWIPSLQVFFMSVLGPFIGSVYDRYGPAVLVAVGSLMHVFGLMMASLATEYYQFMLAQAVCSAIGVAAVFVTAISAVSGWFDKHRGLAYGVLSTGSSIGGVVFPVIISRLIRTVGYGWAMRTVAFVILLLLIVTNLTLRSHRAPATGMPSREQMARPFREAPFMILLGGLSLIPFGLYIPINYMPVAAIGARIPSEMAQNLVAFYNAASIFGRLGSGFLSDKVGKFNVFIGSCYISGILIIAMWIPAASQPSIIAFSVLFGIFSGSYISLMSTLVAQISPPEEVGYRNGLSYLFSAIGGLTAGPIAGAILEGPAGWAGLKTFAGVFILAGTTGVLGARVLKTGFLLRIVF